ncbi:unnamed protein product [Prorocentrum cordatum]|uniref:Aminotransferase class V domain-containing protein n=1 Tax=Prorocentrum cordatum TaxID=2364126 RepID=A0ABN9T9Y6_9DINO|nr:unnamed protein product [Polarella glacialis]
MVDQLKYGIANVGGSYDSSERVGEAVVGSRKAMADMLNCKAALDGGAAPRVGSIGSDERWGTSGGYDIRAGLGSGGAASNGAGSVHDVRAVCARAEELSGGRALRYVDAVHYAPHGHVDVEAIGCDMLACSPYKFFGPHSGVLFGRSELLAELPVDRLDVQDDRLPCDDNCHMSRWEVGTQNHEALAGVVAAVDYLAGLGERFGGADAGAPRRDRLRYAWTAIQAHENELKVRFLEGAERVHGLRVLGVTDPGRVDFRTSTFAIAKDGMTAAELAERLCRRGVWCTAGNHYAGFWGDLSAGLATPDTGMARIGFLHYNTLEDDGSMQCCRCWTPCDAELRAPRAPALPRARAAERAPAGRRARSGLLLCRRIANEGLRSAPTPSSCHPTVPCCPPSPVLLPSPPLLPISHTTTTNFNSNCTYDVMFFSCLQGPVPPKASWAKKGHTRKAPCWWWHLFGHGEWT